LRGKPTRHPVIAGLEPCSKFEIMLYCQRLVYFEGKPATPDAQVGRPEPGNDWRPPD
jgi:hypothetical protein